MTQDLVSRIAKGDESAYKLAFEEHYRMLVVSAYQILKDENISKDAAQEVFLELWKNRERLTDKITLLPYLKRSVMNRALNILKSRKHHMSSGEAPLNVLTDESRQPDQKAEDEELRSIIMKSIERMPDRCRAVFMACRMKGLTHNEIASELGISTKTIENQMTKALKILRSDIAQYKSQLISLLLLFYTPTWGMQIFHLLTGYDL